MFFFFVIKDIFHSAWYQRYKQNDSHHVYKNELKFNKPFANSPFHTKNLAILWAASDFPRQGGPTIVTTRGALKGQGTVAIIPVKLSVNK